MSAVYSGWWKHDGDVALGAEVVDLVGLHLFEDAAEAGAVAEVAVVEDHAGVGVVGVGVEVVDAVGVEGAGAADDAVDFVAFGEQEFGEVGAVLPGDAGDECALHGELLASCRSRAFARLVTRIRRERTVVRRASHKIVR